MRHNQAVNKLSKFLAYVLGRQPDEFGLLPDADGYVKIKDLMKALHEEPGWRHVRSGHLREAIYTISSPAVEMEGKLIRATDRSRMIIPKMANAVPKLLFHPIRQRAYPVIIQNGLDAHHPTSCIVMAAEKDFAQRLGRRIDPSPVILTVNTATACKNGATMWQLGSKQNFY